MMPWLERGDLRVLLPVGLDFETMDGMTDVKSPGAHYVNGAACGSGMYWVFEGRRPNPSAPPLKNLDAFSNSC
jgi:hypothetical protein